MRWFNKILQKRKTSLEKAYEHALYALGYWGKTVREKPETEGFCIKVKESGISVCLLREGEGVK